MARRAPPLGAGARAAAALPARVTDPLQTAERALSTTSRAVATHSAHGIEAQVLSYAPDVIMVNLCNPTLERTLGELALLASQPGFWVLPAVKANQVFVCDHSLFSRPGPRLVDGVELMARIFHPVRARAF